MCVSTKKKLLINNFDNIVKNVILEISYRSNFNIDILETDEDHIHMLISYPPKLYVTSVVRKLKQETIIYLWKNYSKFLYSIIFDIFVSFLFSFMFSLFIINPF